MKRVLIILAIALFSINSLNAQSKYQGYAALGATFIGADLSISNGVNFGKDYIGLGLEFGGWVPIFMEMTWKGIYADYRHDFFVGKENKGSIFLQLSPGFANNKVKVIGQSDDAETADQRPTISNVFYGKFATGYAWHFNNGCGLSLGVNGTLFTLPDAPVMVLPSFKVMFNW